MLLFFCTIIPFGFVCNHFYTIWSINAQEHARCRVFLSDSTIDPGMLPKLAFKVDAYLAEESGSALLGSVSLIVLQLSLSFAFGVFVERGVTFKNALGPKIRSSANHERRRQIVENSYGIYAYTMGKLELVTSYCLGSVQFYFSVTFSR